MTPELLYRIEFFDPSEEKLRLIAETRLERRGQHLWRIAPGSQETRALGSTQRKDLGEAVENLTGRDVGGGIVISVRRTSPRGDVSVTLSSPGRRGRGGCRLTAKTTNGSSHRTCSWA